MKILDRSHSHRRRLVDLTYINKVLTYAPSTYWPMFQKSGTTVPEMVHDWDATASGITLGNTGIGDGETCPWWDGINDYINANLAAFRSAFNGAELSLMMWAKVNSTDVWNDEIQRYLHRVRVDSNNVFYFYKRSGGGTNQMYLDTKAGAVGKSIAVSCAGLGGWLQWVVTRSESAGASGQMKLYRNAVQQGSTQTSLGTWAGVPSATYTWIGSEDQSPANSWHGYIAHVAWWFGRILTLTEIQDLYVIPGV